MQFSLSEGSDKSQYFVEPNSGGFGLERSALNTVTLCRQIPGCSVREIWFLLPFPRGGSGFFSKSFRHLSTSKKEKQSVCQNSSLLHLKHLYKTHLRRNSQCLTRHWWVKRCSLRAAEPQPSVPFLPDRSQLGHSCLLMNVPGLVTADGGVSARPGRAVTQFPVFQHQKEPQCLSREGGRLLLHLRGWAAEEQGNAEMLWVPAALGRVAQPREAPLHSRAGGEGESQCRQIWGAEGALPAFLGLNPEPFGSTK